MNLGALQRWILDKCQHTLPSTIHCAEGDLFYRFLDIKNALAICCPLRGKLVDNYACWCQEFLLANHGGDYSPSTSVDLEPEGVVVVFEVVKFRASKSALGVGPKTPTPEDPVPVTQLRWAGVHGWLQVAAIGTAVSETEIFASSIFHCNMVSSVAVLG